MPTLAIMNQKGGVGKTTTAVTLAHGLALRGFHILIVDLDAQGNVADSLGLQKTSGLYELLIKDRGLLAVTPTGRHNLDAILSDKRTVQTKQILAGESFREQVLKRKLQGHIVDSYRWIILDVAPGVDLLQVSALVAADYYIIPVALAHLAVVGASDALASAASLREVGGLTAAFLGILPTFWERATRESHQQLQILARTFQRLVWPPIPLDTKAREATAHGQTLWEYAPDTRALEGVWLNGQSEVVGGYRRVLDRLLQEVNDGP